MPSTKKLNRALRVEVPSPLRSVAPADGELQPWGIQRMMR